MSQVLWNFHDKRVLVTGGASGIGLAIATAYARAGATVVLLGRTNGSLTTAADAIKTEGNPEIYPVLCDLTSPGEIHRAALHAAELVGTIDILVNNAGVGGSSPLSTLSDAELDLDLQVNLRAAILLTREVIPGMLDRGEGVITNIASQAAKQGFPFISHYSASKAGILGFTRSLAAEVAPTVRVNAICPGKVMTPMMDINIKHTSTTKSISLSEAATEWSRGIPMGRMQKPSDIANAALFLSSDLASEITGEALNVSGGQTTN
jgi:NAD(P)-dependent dehydrogenase (short-subunit alcohol dehydrogenase family)